MALPNGRILGEVMPLLRRVGIEPEPAFDDPTARQLRFATSDPGLDLIRVRSFDVATFVAFGAAQLGVAGNDVLMEFDYSEIYAPLDLDIGHCRMMVAAPGRLGRRRKTRAAGAISASPPNTPRSPAAISPRAASRPKCIKLNGAVELAPVHRAVPAHRRSGADRRDAEGQRPRRDRAHRRHHLAADRQPAGAEDAARRGRLLDRRAARGDRAARARRRPRRRRRADGAHARRRATRASRRRSPRCSPPSARPTPMSTTRSPRSSTTSRARGDAALVDYTARFDRVTLTAARAAPVAAGDRRGRRRRRRPRRSRRCASPPSGSRASTAGNCRRRSTMSMASGCGSACAGGRWRAPGSTCRAAPPPTRPRC